MTDNSRGSAIDRYSAVNELILNTYGQKCVDFSYRKFVKQMQQTSWDTSAGEGGMYDYVLHQILQIMPKMIKHQ